jgi:hypothetical protein
MRAYDSFMQFVAPDTFAGPEEPEAEGYAEFMEMVLRFKSMTIEQKMKLGLDLVEFYRRHPEGGNFYWPPPT